MNKTTMPRGLRNNNPLNIRRGRSRWMGSKEMVQDVQFCEFEEMKWGFRAAYRLLWTYWKIYGKRTLGDIIMRWCPPTDASNDTGAYIVSVCKRVSERMGITYYASTPLLSPRPKDCSELRREEVHRLWVSIVVAMAEVENGRKACLLSEGLEQAAEEGYKLAFQNKPMTDPPPHPSQGRGVDSKRPLYLDWV